MNSWKVEVDRLIYARQREWQGVFCINRLKLRDAVYEIVDPLIAELEAERDALLEVALPIVTRNPDGLSDAELNDFAETVLSIAKAEGREVGDG